MIKEALHSDLAIPPGDFLAEVIDSLGMTKNEFAKRMNRPAAKLSQIFNGSKAITPDTAIQIEKVTNIAAHIWTGLEAEYRLTLALAVQKKQEENLKSESRLVTKYCYAELVKLGLVTQYTKAVDKVRELHMYFGVTSLDNLEAINRYAVLYRQKPGHKSKVSPEAVSAWLRFGEIRGNETECAPYSEKKVKKLVNEIKKFTKLKSDNFGEKLKEIFTGFGIALVIVPHLSKTYAHGAAFWLKDKPVIMVTIRRKWADIFWFSLLHELGHIFLHPKNSVFIESEKEKYNDATKEIEANLFASDSLIPTATYRNFISQNSFFEDDIKAFAKTLGIHPGVVVGRLQYDNLIKPGWHNALRVQLGWK